MPYLLKKVKDGYKVCKKSDPSKCFSEKALTKTKAAKQLQAINISEHEGGKKPSLSESIKIEEARRKANEEAKTKAYQRTGKEARKAKVTRLTREKSTIDDLITKLKNQKDSIKDFISNDASKAKQQEVIKQYDEDIKKVQSYDFYQIKNQKLKDALDKQYGEMLNNMRKNSHTYGAVPDWIGREIGKPEAIKYIYEHYGQGEPDFFGDVIPGIVLNAVSIVPGFNKIVDTVIRPLQDGLQSTIRDWDRKELKFKDIDVSGILEEGVEEDITKLEADREKEVKTKQEELEALDKQEADLQNKSQLITTQLTPEEIGQQAQDILTGTGKPKNKKLYDEITKKVKKDQPKHSLFRSARIQKEYKDAGGTYIGDKPTDKGLKGWFDAKWISMNDYAHDGDIVPCGNARTEERYGEYPLCRPLEVAKKIGRTKALKMLKAKDDLKEKPLFTENILGTKKYNIKPNMVGDAKPLTARLGGKVLLKKTIVDKFFPPPSSYTTYVEPFVGGGSVYFYKDKDNHKEVVNDLDPLIYTLFKGFQKYPGDKIAKAVNGDYDNDDYKKIADSKPSNDFDKFIKAFLMVRISYFGKSKAYGKPRINASFDEYQDRLKDVTILKQDWKSVINKYNVGSETFFYLDPPLVESDSSFYYDRVDLKEIKKAVDAIDDQGNKFLITLTGNTDDFKAYDIYEVKTNIVGDRRKGGQTVTVPAYIVTNYDIVLTGGGKLGKSDEKKQLERGEKTSDLFMKQLEKLQIQPDDYMAVARNLARSKNYDASKLYFANDGDHKLAYDSPEGMRKFGKVGYGDFIIWSFLERMGKVPKGTADKKRYTFQKSHRAMSKDYGLTKYSPNELALNINW